ncbi:MAG: cysteine desulfurase [Pseudomonadota bacterium]|nr:cysteine desulfurase CsdA [Pseudomonadales bacterium]MDY6920001.1 cysteine desulfurase [Pseudomonadota bacterium]
MGSFDIERIRQDFPILHQQVNGKPLVYLDNAATTQKPVAVLDAVNRYYREINSNVHRGAHRLSDLATREFEAARDTVQRFINAPHSHEIIWTRGTTESINLVAQAFGRNSFRPGDEILISAMEHHSNIVPWQILAQQTGAQLKVIPVHADAELDMEAFSRLLSERTRLVSVVHVSNALGTVNPVREIVRQAHEVGARVLLDGAQATPHWNVDVQTLDCDFYAFSGHKVFGPTGIGVLYGRTELLEQMAPYQAGGEMIEKVSFSGTTYNTLPYKFEAGTPHIAGAIGLAAAIDYLAQFDREQLLAHEQRLLEATLERAGADPQIQLIGRARDRASVFSFLLEGAHPNDVGTLLDQQGIAVRTGHHCAMPIMDQFNIPGTVRASFAFYNTLDEVERLFAGLEKCKTFLL